jgi:hypothetical protein
MNVDIKRSCNLMIIKVNNNNNNNDDDDVQNSALNIY